MLKKKYIKSRNVCKVIFGLPVAEIPEDIEVDHVHLVGDFNDWNISEIPMKRNKKKIFQAVLDLEPGVAYQFRYVVNGEHWINDWQADNYVANYFGQDNCVVATLTGNDSN